MKKFSGISANKWIGVSVQAYEEGEESRTNLFQGKEKTKQRNNR